MVACSRERVAGLWSLLVVSPVDTSSVTSSCVFCVPPSKESLPLPSFFFVDVQQSVMKYKFRLLSCARSLFNVFIMQLE